MSKFNIFTIDLRVILWIIVATGVYSLLLKFLQKNSPHDVQTKGGGGGKGLLNNVKKKLHFSLMSASLRVNSFQVKNRIAVWSRCISRIFLTLDEKEYLLSSV